MADPTKTFTLLTELEDIDVHEDRILDELLRRGAALEETERRSRMVTVAELHALRAGLDSLETAIASLQSGVARAEAAADEHGEAKPANGNGGPKAYGPTAPGPPAPAAAPVPLESPGPAGGSPPAAEVSPPATFEQLAARIRENDADGDCLRAMLRERFASFDDDAAEPSPEAPAAGPAGDVPPLTVAGHTVGAAPPVAAGHAAVPAAVAPHRTLRLTNPPMEGTDVKLLQDALNHRFASWEVGLHVAEDGVYGSATRQAAGRVARGLGIAPAQLAHGITPAVRVLIRNPSRRTAQQLARAKAASAWLKALRKRYPAGGSHAAASGHAAPAAHPATATGGVQAAIRKHGGRYEDIIVHEAQAQGVRVSLVCAVMQMESGFRNVYGHDAVPNPIKSPPGGLLEVTEHNYREYLRHRNGGEGSQGVGPMQLTYHTLQDRADALGGCFKPAVNIKVGVELLASNIKAHGEHAGVRSYNGTGAAAEAYADKVLALDRVWRSRLDGAAAAASTHAGGGGGEHHAPATSHAPAHSVAPATAHAPRTFKLTTQPMSGNDVKAFQEVLNGRMERWDVDLRIEEDGVYGPDTRTMARRVARGLGVEPGAYEHGITPATRQLVRSPKRRTAQQLQRARAARTWLKALRKRYAVAGSGGGSYPLAKRGKLIGIPYQGTHTLGNWQSDNAVDLGVPVGTPMIALDDGMVTKLTPHAQDGSRFAGDAITIKGDRGNAYFYKHGVASVKAGQRVRRGQVIGTSGSASGVAHLHLGVMKGDPRDIIGQH